MIHPLLTVKGSELKARRDRLGFTQEELAKRLDVKRLSIIRWESDQVEIPRTVELALKEIERQEGR
jgi:transcriptional regulator with XRE-family HTH domain